MFRSFLFRSWNRQWSTLNARKMFLKFEETKMSSLTYCIYFVNCIYSVESNVACIPCAYFTWARVDSYLQRELCAFLSSLPLLLVRLRRSADHRFIRFEALGSDTVADVRLCAHTRCQSTAVNYFESQLPSPFQTPGQSELIWVCTIIVSSGGLANRNYTESLNC